MSATRQRLIAAILLGLVSIPQAANPSDAPSIQPSGRYLYRVQPGDSLSEIAERFLGRASSWRRIADANSIADPRHLEQGGWIDIPFGAGDLFGHAWFPQPYLADPALRIALDLDGDGNDESLRFEPIFTQRPREQPEALAELHCRIERAGQPPSALQIGRGGIALQLRWAATWPTGYGDHVLAVDIWQEHGAAVASAHADLRFFHLDSDGEATLLYTLEEIAGIQHHSAGSGSSAESQLRAIRGTDGLGFEVVTRYVTGSWDVEPGRLKVDTSETRYELVYKRKEPALALAHRETTSSSHWEEPEP